MDACAGVSVLMRLLNGTEQSPWHMRVSLVCVPHGAARIGSALLCSALLSDRSRGARPGNEQHSGKQKRTTRHHDASTQHKPQRTLDKATAAGNSAVSS